MEHIYIYIYIFFFSPKKRKKEKRRRVKPIYECKRGSNKLFMVGGIKFGLFKLRPVHERK